MKKYSLVVRVMKNYSHLLRVKKKTHLLLNQAFVRLGSFDNVQTERSIFEYANWPRLQVKRTGPSSWSVQQKMPQSGVGSMQGKNTGNMPSAVCASSINKSLDPTPI